MTTSIPIGRSGLRLALAVMMLTTLASFAAPASVAAEPSYPFAWDPQLWQAPRPSPLPLQFAAVKGFHRSLVQVTDGGLAVPFLDVYLPAGMQPLIIKRQYRSGLRTAGVFGTGWTSNLDLHLTRTGSGLPRIVEGDGQVTSYELESADHYRPVAGAFPSNVLSRSNDKWVREWSDGVKEIFDGSGRLEERRTATDALKFSYPEATSQQPNEITDAAGHRAKLTYHDGLLVELQFPTGRSIRYSYEARSLSVIVDPIGRRERELLGDDAAHRPSEDIRTREIGVVENGDDIVRHVRHRERLVGDVGMTGAAVADAQQPLLFLERGDKCLWPEQPRCGEAGQQHEG